MSKDRLIIKGARAHNLKNISLEIPKNKLVVFTGVSGSGKSSLVFDTIYSEGQRRYVESLSSYARQFLGVMDKADVDSISGIAPAIAIDQKSVSKNPRSTVGTITEIYDYIRLLYANVGLPHCPNCNILIEASSVNDIFKNIKKLHGEIVILAPLVSEKKGEHKAILEEVENGGFVRVRLDKHLMEISEALNAKLDPNKKHSIDVVIDRIVINSSDVVLDKIRLLDSIETALKLGNGILITIGGSVLPIGRTDPPMQERVFSEKFACNICGFSMREVEPRIFSFNSPYGACEHCSGLGTKMEVDPRLVMPNLNLTLAEGAIKPWMSASHRVGRQSWYWLVLKRMSEAHGFSMNVSIKKLSKNNRDIILYGDKNNEGVIKNLERRHKETNSDWTRNEIEKYMNIRKCPKCKGMRLRPEALAVKILNHSIHDVVIKNILDANTFFAELINNSQFNVSQKKVAFPIIKEIKSRLEFLQKVGLHYLSLARKSGTLSGGEAQRIRLATQLGSSLSGVFYILDEPSVGLHARDQKRLIKTIKELRDLGNSVLVVEHDPLTIKEADYIVDIGPGAGKHGGRIIFEGTPIDMKKSNTLTADYFTGRKIVNGLGVSLDKTHKLDQGFNFSAETNLSESDKASDKATSKQKYLTIKGACHNNLKNIDVTFPLGKLVCVSGVSGSGKSSLLNDILAKALVREYHSAQTIAGKHKAIIGLGYLDKVVIIDQSPIGRTPRSNTATYTGAFTHMRDLYTATPDARIRGYEPGRFSFNVKGGRCEKCRGGGVIKIEMFFMPDIYIECEVCLGKRYNKEVLEIYYKGKNIAEVLSMTIEEASDFFKNIPSLKIKLDVLLRVGLGYIELGQPAPSLSGGEAQRVKLATELSRKATGKTLYILDEPTTGLHADDVNKLLSVLKELVSMGNSVIVIEHNMDILKNADWIIDLGPEGGDAGGEIVAEGTPEQIKKIKKSYTGNYLKKVN